MRYSLIAASLFLFVVGCAASNGTEKKSGMKKGAKPNYNSVQSSEKQNRTAPPKGTQKSGATPKKSGPSLPKANGPIAHVNGNPVPADRFNKQIETISKSGRVSPQMIGKIKDSLIDKMIDQFLIDQAIDENKIQIKQKEIEKHLDRLRKRYKKSAKGPDKEATLDEAVNKMGVSKEDFKESVRKSIAIRKLLKKKGHLKEPTKKELKRFYDDNSSKFSRPEQIRLRQIVFKASAKDGEDAWDKTQQKALKVRDSVESENTTFKAAAKKHSEGSKAKKGGDLGFLTNKQIQNKLGGNFKSIISQLEDGKISDPIRSAYGWHLVKRIETKEKQTVPFKKVKNQLKRQIRARRMKKGLKDLVAELKGEAKIEKHPDNIE